MRKELEKLYREVDGCMRCEDTLGAKGILSRFGFPPREKYVAVVVGSEPGQRAFTHGRMTPEDYVKVFSPFAKNTNKAKLFFRDMAEAGLPYESFFFTNAVKCPVSKQAAKTCFARCGAYLEKQISAIHPAFIVLWGTAPGYLRMSEAACGEILSGTLFGVPTITINHPQGATLAYRQQVVGAVRRLFK